MTTKNSCTSLWIAFLQVPGSVAFICPLVWYYREEIIQKDHLLNIEMLREEIDSLWSLDFCSGADDPESDQRLVVYQAEELIGTWTLSLRSDSELHVQTMEFHEISTYKGNSWAKNGETPRSQSPSLRLSFCKEVNHHPTIWIQKKLRSGKRQLGRVIRGPFGREAKEVVDFWLENTSRYIADFCRSSS